MLYVKMRAQVGGANEPVVIGSFILDAEGQVGVHASSPSGVRILNEILQQSQTEPILGEFGREYLLPDDPEAWLRALPFQYHGSYMNAELIEE